MFKRNARPLKPENSTSHQGSARTASWLPTVLLAGALAFGGFAQDAFSGNPALAGNFCSATADAAFTACEAEVEDDFWIAKGNCINVAKTGARNQCNKAADAEREEGLELCGEQFQARLDVCGLVGEGRYAPNFKPANFVDPAEIGDTVATNPFFPLVVGNTWVYEGGGETVTVVVTSKTKLIAGVTCRVVNDLVEEDGAAIEDTDDWYAQHLNGDVWYCGEIARDFETFEGDDPEEPELVSIDGSFKAGRDRAKPGILVLASPEVGDAYRQEFALGEAEDVAEVISTTGTASVPFTSCVGDCVVTRDFTPLEPGALENKYYAAGVGPILEVDPETGERLELIDFTPGTP